MLNFYEFFAGAGMVRAGLSDPAWRCAFANDFDHKKGETYARNWGKAELHIADVRTVTPDLLPGCADLAWASFPCQDLSLAGGGAGLKGGRSGTFWPFWDLMTGLVAANRAPRVIALENVLGTLTSHRGEDFVSICDTFVRAGYRFGAMVIDAAHFVPQSRPRVFIVGVSDAMDIPDFLRDAGAQDHLSSRALLAAHGRLPPSHREHWIWWSLPRPPVRNANFASLLEPNPGDVRWFSRTQTQKLIDMMAEPHLEKL
jgi:DNA (cytosine-5)-methyltransferase 1